MSRQEIQKNNYMLNHCYMITRHPNVFLFFFFSIGYFLWRYVGFNYLVWDDTSSVSYNIFVNNRYYSFSNKQFLFNAIKDTFGSLQGDGYRPFAALWKILGIAYFSTPANNLAPFIAINAFITGLLAVAYFHLAKHFLRTTLAAFFAVFLLLFSTPILTGLLIVCTGVHVFVALFISLGLLCYLRLVDKGTHKAILLSGLFAIMLIGPLFREFIGLVSLLVIILELQRVRRLNWLIIWSSIFFLHAIFPTAIIKWTMFPKLPLLPVFAMGNLGDFMQRGIGTGGFLHVLGSTILHLHWRIFIDIISVYPATAFVLLFLLWRLKFKRAGIIAIDKNTAFLLIVFLLSFLPFLKIFNEQVHLSYSLVPMSILLAAAMEELWFMTLSGRFQRIFKKILFILIIMIIVDHVFNVYAVRKVTRDMYTGIMKSAKWFVDNVPKGTPVITNAHHLEDIRFYSNGHIEPWGAPGGIPDQRRWMHNPSDLQKLLDAREGRQLYFFDVVIKKPAGQRGEERVLFYVRDKNVEMADLGILYKTESRYPFFDPLKYLIPTKEITWVGPPDLEFDFYRGLSLDGTPFRREVYAEYHIYKATGDKVNFNQKYPQLLEQNYHGFNLVLFRDRVYAIPQPEGAFEIERVEKGGYSRSFQGSSAAEVKKAIDKEFAFSGPTSNKVASNEKYPQLLEQNYHGFNLVLFRDRVYAIPQPEGAFEIERVEKNGYSRSFQGSSAQEVKKAIDKKFNFVTDFLNFCKRKLQRIFSKLKSKK